VFENLVAFPFAPIQNLDHALLAVLKVTTQPVIVSLDSRTGGNPKMAEMMKPRLISKEQAKVVAGAVIGVIGVWTHLADSLKDFVESIKAMVDAVGIDHAGIGTDTDLLSARVGQGTNNAWPGLTGGFFRWWSARCWYRASRLTISARSAVETSAASLAK
jgi:microsomal dipeptidase-like Zn-dependent dipeptidase